MAGSATDEELFAAWVAGDPSGFREIFARYAPLLLRICGRGLLRPDVAEDLVQQTFVRLHRARHDFRAGARLRPFVVTVALNVKREHLRALKRRPDAKLEHEPTAATPSPEEALAAGQRDREVRAALAALPAGQREVVELHWLEGLAFSEVAELLGTTEGAVKVRAHRGYARLRIALAAGRIRGDVPDVGGRRDHP